jgi:NitT/TauT family transport system substrate-binding protein
MKHLLAGAAAIASSVFLATSGNASDAVRLLLDYVPDAGHAPFFFARDQGAYKDAGIDLAIEFGKGSGYAAQAVGAGAVPLGVADFPTSLVAAGKGADLVAVMNIYSATPQSFYWLKSSGIAGVRDFPGHSIGNPPGDSTRAIWPAFAKVVGIDATTVKFVNVAPMAKNSALQTRQVDIISDYYNKLDLEISQFGEDLAYVSWRGVGFNLHGKGVIANGQFLKEKPDLVKRFVAVTQRAYAACFHDVDPCLRSLLASASGLNMPTEVAEWKRLSELMRSNEWEQVAIGWYDAKRVSADYNLISTYIGLDKPYDPNSVFTDDLLDRSIKLPK